MSRYSSIQDLNSRIASQSPLSWSKLEEWSRYSESRYKWACMVRRRETITYLNESTGSARCQGDQ